MLSSRGSTMVGLRRRADRDTGAVVTTPDADVGVDSGAAIGTRNDFMVLARESTRTTLFGATDTRRRPRQTGCQHGEGPHASEEHAPCQHTAT